MVGSNDHEEPGWFLVTSIGRTATYWLSWSLNQHPDILCSHGAHIPPKMVTLGDSGSVETGLNRSGNPIRSFYDIPKDAVSEADQQDLRRSQDRFHGMPLGEVLDAHRDLGDFKLIGNVHGYTLKNAIERMLSGQAERTVSIVNLIRNPIGQILSFSGRHLFDSERDAAYMAARINIVHQRSDFAAALGDKYGIDLTDRATLIFLSAVIEVAALQRDILITNALHVPYELLTQSPDVFRKLIGLISGGRTIETDDSYVESVFASGPMNYSSKTETRVAEAFAALEPWQQAAMNELLTQDVIERYRTMGYELGFFTSQAGGT